MWGPAWQGTVLCIRLLLRGRGAPPPSPRIAPPNTRPPPRRLRLAGWRSTSGRGRSRMAALRQLLRPPSLGLRPSAAPIAPSRPAAVRPARRSVRRLCTTMAAQVRGRTACQAPRDQACQLLSGEGGVDLKQSWTIVGTGRIGSALAEMGENDVRLPAGCSSAGWPRASTARLRRYLIPGGCQAGRAGAGWRGGPHRSLHPQRRPSGSRGRGSRAATWR